MSNVQISTSPLNGAVQTVELPGARWRATYTYANSQGEDLALLQTLLVELRGQAGRVNVPCYERIGPRGIGGGAPKVDGNSQTGSSLAIKEAPISATGWLRKGDYVSFGATPELHMVRGDVDTNGVGQAVILIEPPIRNSPFTDDLIEIVRPSTQMMLVDNIVTWTTVPGGVPTADIILDFVETWA